MKRSVRHIFIMAFSLLSLTVCAAFGLLVYYDLQVKEYKARYNDHLQINADLSQLISLSAEWIYVPTPRIERQTRFLTERIKQSLRDQSGQAGAEAEVRLNLRRLKNYNDYRSRLQRISDRYAGDLKRLQRARGMILTRVGEELGGIRSVVESHLVEITSREERLQKKMFIVGGFALLATILAFVFLAYTTLKQVLNPIRSLQKALDSFAAGEYGARLGEYSSYELDKVAQTFNQMATKLTETIHRLSLSNQELESFAYSVSHDLRAPLRAMDGFSQVLIEDFGEQLDEQGRNYLQRVRDASCKMGELIEDILKLSRIGRADLSVQEGIDLGGLAREVWRDFDASSQVAPKVELVVEKTAPVHGDNALLRVALTNLLSNAHKFSCTGTEPKVIFGCEERTDGMVFFVRDNGAGFDSRHKAQLFEPFKRLHSKTEFDGNGIGLAIVKRVISKHQGRIWADGEIGQGATFYFTLFDEGGEHGRSESAYPAG